MKRRNALKRIHRGKLPWLYLLAAVILLPFMLELALADTRDQITIERFEISDPVFAQTVEAGRKRADIELPESIPAIVPIEEGVDLSAFKQEEPPLEETGINQLQSQLLKEKYVAPENAKELYRTGEMVLYEFDREADGTVEHRVYGSLDGGEESWFVCDAKGSIEKQMINIPVTWEGDYDSEKAGSFPLVAQWENYLYEGEHPSGTITVESAKSDEGEENKAAGDKEEPEVPEEPEEPEAPEEPEDQTPAGKASPPTTWITVNYTQKGIPIIDFQKNIVLINENAGTMMGYDTLLDAMKAIGTNVNAYHIVFVKTSYTVTTADLNAVRDNGKKAKKLTVTSTYYNGSQEIKATVTSPAASWLLPASTEFKDIRFSVAAGAANVIANGYKLTMGNGIENSGSGGIDVYGGSSSAYKGDSNVTMLSGTYRNVYGGSYAGAMTGKVSLDISGKTVVNTLYGGSRNVTQVGSVQMNIEGANGAKITTIYGAGSGTNGLLSSSSLVNIVIKDMQGITMVDDATRNNGTGKTFIAGKVQVTGNILSKSMLDIGQNGELLSGGTLNLHSMTLNAGARLTKTSSGANTISGLLKVTGANARISLYKASDTSVPTKLTLQSLDASAVLTLAYTNGVKGQNNDVLLTFSIASNISNYFNKDIASNAVLHLERSGANLILSSAAVPTPSYYQTTSVSGVYKYTDIGSSNNDEPVYYRKKGQDGAWHACSANGSNMELVPVDHQQEHPQPNTTTQKSVSFGLLQDDMILYEEFGKYRMNVITSSAKRKKDVNYSEGAWINAGNKGKSNATKDVLKQTTSTSKIHKAILIMSTVDTDSQTLVNQPMVLEGPKGHTIRSNGYLPEGFTSMSGGLGTLSSDKPCLLRNVRNGIMMLTDVTDFVKAEGYGTYYGIDLVGSAAKVPDYGINWRLLVFEEDPSLPNNTFTRWAVGPKLIPNGSSIQLDMDLKGLTTPVSGNFKGQILLGGQSGDMGGAGDVRIYPDRNNNSQSYLMGSDDPSTTDRVERPTNGGAAQDMVDVDGIRNRNSSGFQSTQNAVKGDGQDLGLFNVTTVQNTGWQTKGGHNLYFKNKSSGIKMLITMRMNQAYTPDLLAISTEVQLPEFSSDIMHTDIQSIEGADVVAGQAVHVKAEAMNITASTANFTGTANTKAVIEVDPSLSNVREIVGIFSKFNPSGGTYTNYEVPGIYDPVEHTITFDFGQDTGTIPLLNQRGDKISINFTCTTSKEPKNNITNVIKVNASNAINGVGQQVDLSVKEYARSEDRFNSFKMPVTISKTGIVKNVEGTGTLAKPVYVEDNEIYTYKITLSNSSKNAISGMTVQDVIPAGLELVKTSGSYTSGMVYATDAKTKLTTVRWENQKIEGTSGTAKTKVYTFQVRVVTPMLYQNTAELMFEESNAPINSNTVYHQGHGIAKVRLKKVIGNYQADLKDQVFFLKLSNGVDAQVVLSHDKVSPYIKLVMTPQMLSAGVAFDVSEIVPMEYDPNYKVSIQLDSGSAGTQPVISGRRIKVYPDNLVTITVTNTFKQQPYFKGRDYTQNLFKP